jgi:tryptophan 2,3-dioxygenase
MGDDLWLWRQDGDPRWSVLAVSLLTGKPPEQIDPYAPLSADWSKDARRRISEAEAATGSERLGDILRYWALRELGIDVLDLGDEIRILEFPANL